MSTKSRMALGDDVVFAGKESDRQECRVHRYIARAKVDLFNNSTWYNFANVLELAPRAFMYIGSLASRGDSGAIVVKEGLSLAVANQAYGLLFAGNGRRGMCCFMENVCNELNRPVGGSTLDLVMGLGNV